MYFLNDNWMISGTSMELFKKEIAQFTKQTHIVEVPMDQLNFLNLTDTGTELTAVPLHSKQLWKKTKASFLLRKFPMELSYLSHYDAETQAEAVLNGLLVHCKNQTLSLANIKENVKEQRYIPVSKKAMGTISNRIQMGGSGFIDRGLIRDLTIANYFSKPIPVKLVMRREDSTNTAKLFAVMSQKYSPIHQMILSEIVDQIAANAKKELGGIECHHWLINHDVTRIYLDFPDCQADFADEYHLPDHILPGIMIETSDIGESALRVKGYFKLNGVLTYMEPEFLQIHSGTLNLEKMMETITSQIFPEYRVYPEKLAEFMMIDLTVETMSAAARIQKMTSVYRSISKFIGLVKAIGKKREKSLLDQLIAGIHPEIDYTAYDIAQTFLTLSNTIETDHQSLLDLIANTVGKVMDYDFNSKEEEDLLVI